MIHIEEKNVRKVFTVSLILKGFNSLLEIFSGTVLLFTGSVTAIITFFIQNELIEDPTDFLAIQIQHFLPYFSEYGQLYISLYLLSHGIVKIILVISLLRNKIWAYPATIFALSLFVLYQLYRLSYGFSYTLILLTCFDIFIIYLTWHEYKIMKKHISLPNLKQES